MRPGQQKNRMRGRGRKGPNPLSRSYESNGPDVKIRGNAQHVADKYAQLARDAAASGDRVMAENYLQHAEHYYRIIAQAQPQGQGQRDDRDQHDDDDDDDMHSGNDRFDRREFGNSTANNDRAERQDGNQNSSGGDNGDRQNERSDRSDRSERSDRPDRRDRDNSDRNERRNRNNRNRDNNRDRGGRDDRPRRDRDSDVEPAGTGPQPVIAEVRAKRNEDADDRNEDRRTAASVTETAPSHHSEDISETAATISSVSETATTEPVGNTAEEAKPRKRGRPRKSAASAADAETGEVDAAAEDAPAKRRPGRPRKVKDAEKNSDEQTASGEDRSELPDFLLASNG
ncbi:DUF4167 domain-containing protein [Fulvimarina endophytica]|uniref:DUF4167 domain-containing protein n=1 Tax=Fulvimarina endophytica TaxID=2293836 RepID=A0A371XAP5_9HYPH|nr:DUF4167 domain-containing protein [Fulvimarina endophytica]RFC66306.1 DUF4167 domain-containing protein [Fulvimarina endophytica]